MFTPIGFISSSVEVKVKGESIVKKRASHTYISRVLVSIEIVLIMELTRFCLNSNLLIVVIEHEVVLFASYNMSKDQILEIKEKVQAEFNEFCLAFLETRIFIGISLKSYYILVTFLRKNRKIM